MRAGAGGLSPELSEDKQFRVKLTIFWVGVIAAIIAAFAVRVPWVGKLYRSRGG